MSSDRIKAELSRIHPDTQAAQWKRRSRSKTDAGTVRVFEHADGRLVETIEAADGTISTRAVDDPRIAFDRAIEAAFKGPLMENEGYGSWSDLMEDYDYANAGEILAGAMISCCGPTPDRFYRAGPETGGARLYDNLCGLENVEYVEHEGRPTYEMDVDRSGHAPRIGVFLVDGRFDIEQITA